MAENDIAEDNLVLITNELYNDLKQNHRLKGFRLYFSDYGEGVNIENFNQYEFEHDITYTSYGEIGFDFFDNRLLSVDMGTLNISQFHSCGLYYFKDDQTLIEDKILGFWIKLNVYSDDMSLKLVKAFNIFNFDMSPIPIRAKLTSFNHRSVSTHDHDLSLSGDVATSAIDAVSFFTLYMQNRDSANVSYDPIDDTTQTVRIKDNFNFERVADGENIRDLTNLNLNMSPITVQRSISKNMNEAYYIEKNAIKLLGQEIPTQTSTDGYVYMIKNNKLYKCLLSVFIEYLQENVNV